MPQALEVDHEKVKMVALQIGVREAARQFGLKECTVIQWSKREKWFEHRELVEQAKALKIEKQELSSVVIKSAAEIVDNYKNQSKLSLASTIHKTATALENQDDDKLVKNTSALLNATSSWAKLHASEQEHARSLVNVNIMSTSVPDVSHVADA